MAIIPTYDETFRSQNFHRIEKANPLAYLKFLTPLIVPTGLQTDLSPETTKELLTCLYCNTKEGRIILVMSYLWKPEPAWLTSACVRAIHDIIKNKKICLKLHKSKFLKKRSQFQCNKIEAIVAISDENEDKLKIKCILEPHPFNAPAKGRSKKNFIITQLFSIFQ